MADIKLQIAEEVKAQLTLLKSEIKQELKEEMRKEIAGLTKKINTKIDETCAKIAESAENTNDNQLAKIQSNELAIITDKMVKSMVKLETRILDKINDRYDPIIRDFKMMNDYHHQDTDQLLTDYRTAVLSNDELHSNVKLLTGRGDVKHIISENVRLAFTYDDM